MKFEIVKKSTSSTEIKVAFYDISGNLIGTSTVTIPAGEIHLDTRVVQLAEKSFIFFPYGFYTDEIALKDAIKIYNYYDKNDYPLIYTGIENLLNNNLEELGEKSKENIINELKTTFKEVKKSGYETDKVSHGIAIHELQSIVDFRLGYIYKVLCHPHTGAVEIVEE